MKLRDLNWIENNGYGKNKENYVHDLLVKIKISRSHIEVHKYFIYYKINLSN